MKTKLKACILVLGLLAFAAPSPMVGAASTMKPNTSLDFAPDCSDSEIGAMAQATFIGGEDAGDWRLTTQVSHLTGSTSGTTTVNHGFTVTPTETLAFWAPSVCGEWDSCTATSRLYRYDAVLSAWVAETPAKPGPCGKISTVIGNPVPTCAPVKKTMAGFWKYFDSPIADTVLGEEPPGASWYHASWHTTQPMKPKSATECKKDGPLRCDLITVAAVDQYGPDAIIAQGEYHGLPWVGSVACNYEHASINGYAVSLFHVSGHDV